MKQFNFKNRGGGRIIFCLLFSSIMFACVHAQTTLPITPGLYDYGYSSLPPDPPCPISVIPLSEELGSMDPYIEIGTNAIATVEDLENALGGSANLDGKHILLSGLFNVEKPWTLSNCTIEAVGRIDIGEDNGIFTSFNATNCKFYSTTVMWQGITVYGANKIELKNCRVEDALFAVAIQPLNSAIPAIPANPIVTLQSTVFNRNLVGIYCDGTDDAPASNPTVNLANVSDCQFTQFSGDLLPSVFNPSFFYETGIYVNQVALSLGKIISTGLCARFSCLNNGIVAINSPASVNGKCIFENMRVTDKGTITSGCGIFCSFGEIRVGHGQPSEFNNNAIGVLTEFSSARVYKSKFEGNFLAIQCDLNDAMQVSYINDNTINMGEGDLFGIVVERSKFAPLSSPPRVLILNNNITRTASSINPTDPTEGGFIRGIYAIRLFCPTPVNGSCIVRNNKYTDQSLLNEGFFFDHGISVQSAAFAGTSISISDNQVKYTNQSTQSAEKIGFYTELPSSSGISVRNNRVEGSKDQTDNKNYGFVTFSTERSLFCNNTVAKVGIGMYFQGTNNPLTLKTSTIGNCTDAGLVLLQTGLGIQDRFGNEWATGSSAYGINAAYADPQSAADSRINADITVPAQYPLGDIFPSFGWFNDLSGSNTSCATPTNGGGGDQPRITDSDRSLFNGDVGLTEFSAYRLWERKVNTLSKLDINPALRQNDQQAADYFTTEIGSSAGKFAVFNKKVLDAYLTENQTPEFVALELLQVQIENLGETLAFADSVLSAGNLSVSAAGLWKNNWEITGRDLSTALANMKMQSLQQRQRLQISLEGARNYNASISAQTAHEISERTFNDVWLKGVINGGFDENDLAILKTLSLQDQNIIGSSVMRASMCLQVLKKKNQDRSEYTKASIETYTPALHIYPNPARQDITISSTTPLDGAWQIVDIAGRPLITGRANPNQPLLQVSVSTLAAGTYYFVARQTNGIPVHHTFVVIR